MNYILPLRYLLIMTVQLLLTGLWMFWLHTSLSIEGTTDYYSPKSLFGLLETVSPHLFGMGLILFILIHFFAVIKGVEQEKYKWFSVCFFLLMLFTNLSGFFISHEGLFFTVIKLISTLLFILYSFIAIYKLIKISTD